MFTRTTCACKECVSCCKEQPGYCGDGDVERILDHLGKTFKDAPLYFWASPGAVVLHHDGIQRRVPTITPRLVKGKGCVFLDEQNRCSIHAVAPVGCSMFDTHMSAQEGRRRSEWFLRGIINNHVYKSIRDMLPFASSYRPKGY